MYVSYVYSHKIYIAFPLEFIYCGVDTVQVWLQVDKFITYFFHEIAIKLLLSSFVLSLLLFFSLFHIYLYLRWNITLVPKSLLPEQEQD